ncbi:unnamed protein product [Candidula unifasciata]|uniref:IST1 homolog n=1 Tax=Candidula unifasciata TaxID=100452 RepID=A0A8S3YJY1_9EUPU|nr:unnamed protein product [Candidula unifasciata]
MFKSGPNYTKLKTNLRLVINRLKLLEKKKTEMALKARKEIADYISAGKEDRARIRVEHIIREDYLVEAMELLEMHCDLLLARFGLIQTQKDLDPSLEEPIASLIWATPRLQADIQELKSITKHFTRKYGQQFAYECTSNKRSNVNEKIMHKLSVHAPPKALVEHYMVEIAKTYNVPFQPDLSALHGDTVDVHPLNRGGNSGGGPHGGTGILQPGIYDSLSKPVSQTKFPASQGNSGLPNILSHGHYDHLSTTNNAGLYASSPVPSHFDHSDPPPKPARTFGLSAPPPYITNGETGMPTNSFPGFRSAVENGLINTQGRVGDTDFDELSKRFEELKNKQ